jgi:hypothetical protein
MFIYSLVVLVTVIYVLIRKWNCCKTIQVQLVESEYHSDESASENETKSDDEKELEPEEAPEPQRTPRPPVNRVLTSSVVYHD